MVEHDGAGVVRFKQLLSLLLEDRYAAGGDREIALGLFAVEPDLLAQDLSWR